MAQYIGCLTASKYGGGSIPRSGCRHVRHEPPVAELYEATLSIAGCQAPRKTTTRAMRRCSRGITPTRTADYVYAKRLVKWSSY